MTWSVGVRITAGQRSQSESSADGRRRGTGRNSPKKKKNNKCSQLKARANAWRKVTRKIQEFPNSSSCLASAPLFRPSVAGRRRPRPGQLDHFSESYFDGVAVKVPLAPEEDEGGSLGNEEKGHPAGPVIDGDTRCGQVSEME